MADPAWGTASSLSDEETARALCAFHDTEPLPTQRRHPLQLQQQQQQQQQAPLYRPSDQRSREVPQLGGFSAFGYPSSGTYHMVPMTVQRSDAASVLVGMHAPSTSSDDWQQRRTKQELEQQQRELQAVTQSRQQQDMQRQLHQLQAQIQQQQQEQAHRHHQAQVQRQVERIQEPRYSSSGLGGFDQTRWNNGAYAQSSAASSFSGADSDRIQGAAMQHGVQMQQNGRFYGGDFQQRAQPVPIRPATTPTGTGSYPAISYGEGSPPAGMLANRNDALFAPQQMPKPAQSHFRARSTNLFGASALQSWGRSESMSLSGMQAARTKSFQMQSDPRFVPQQQQPQPYYAAEPSERKYQEPPARSHASQSVPDVFFLDGIMRHFPASSETVGEAPTRSTAVPARSNCESIEARGNAFEFAPTQYRTQAQPPLGMQTQMEVQSRTTVPPTGAVIVPGVSLASQPIRLVTMRDLLNGDEAKADKSRGRPRGNQQRAPQKRKAPKKKTPAKRQRMPQQPNEQRPQHPPMNRSVRPSQNPSLAPSGGPALASKPASPMYLAFMESRAARALEQKSGTTAANSSTPGIQTPEPQLSILAAQVPARQTSNKSVDLVAAEATPVKQKRGSYKRKKTGFPPESRTQEQSVGTSVPSIPIQATSEPTASSNEQLSELPQASIVTTAKQVDVLVQVNYQANSSCISDDLMNGKFEQRQEPPKLAVPVEATKSVQPSLNTDKAANGKLGKSSRRRRTTKLPQPGSNAPGIVRGEQQPVSSALPAPVGASAEVVPSTAIAAAPSCADNPPRVENRTIVIFCKRDFMRYQAAKIWRRYQEQLKKQEEWREVRVAGKRTRYLNSRYDDELRRTHRKPTNKRSGNRPRGRAAAPKSQEINGHEVSTPAEGRAVASSAPSTSTSASNENDEGGHLAKDSGTTSATDAVGSRASLDVCDVHSSGAYPLGNTDNGDHVTTQGASDPQQERAYSLVVKQGEEGIAKNMDGSRVMNEPGYGMLKDSINSNERLAMAPDINSEIAVAGVLATSNAEIAGVVADVAYDAKAVPSTADVSSNGGLKLAIAAGITDPTEAGGGNNNKGTSANLDGCVATRTYCGSIGTIVSSAAIPREVTKEALNDDASCSSGKRRPSTSADLNQAHRDSIKQACAVPAMTSDDSVETCTSSRMSFMPNGVTTSDDGGNPADTSIQLDRDPSGTTIVAKPIPISADLETATNGGTAEIDPCAASPISDSLKLGKPAHADPVANSNGSAAV